MKRHAIVIAAVAALVFTSYAAFALGYRAAIATATEGR